MRHATQMLGRTAALTFDREPPVQQILREVVNPDKTVRIGERLLIRGISDRKCQYEITRRWWLVDGAGRRLDYEAERFDAYGDLGRAETTIGPTTPLDAMPGNGVRRGVVAYDGHPLQRTLGWSTLSMLQPLEFDILPKVPS